MPTEEQSDSSRPESEVAKETTAAGNPNPDGGQPKYQARSPAQKEDTFLQKARQFFSEPKAWMELAALVVVVCYTRYAGQQVAAMRDTLAEVKKQTGFAETSAKAASAAAKTAQDAINAAGDNFIQDERPYIWTSNNPGIPPAGETAYPIRFRHFVGEPADVGHVEWTFHFTNYGRSPAQGVRIWAWVDTGDNLMERRHHPGANPDMGFPIPPTKDGFASPESAPITQAEFVGLMNKEDSIALRVRFTYTDSSRKGVYETSICVVRLVVGPARSCDRDNYIK